MPRSPLAYLTTQAAAGVLLLLTFFLFFESGSGAAAVAYALGFAGSALLVWALIALTYHSPSLAGLRFLSPTARRHPRWMMVAGTGAILFSVVASLWLVGAGQPPSSIFFQGFTGGLVLAGMLGYLWFELGLQRTWRLPVEAARVPGPPLATAPPAPSYRLPERLSGVRTLAVVGGVLLIAGGLAGFFVTGIIGLVALVLFEQAVSKGERRTMGHVWKLAIVGCATSLVVLTFAVGLATSFLPVPPEPHPDWYFWESLSMGITGAVGLVGGVIVLLTSRRILPHLPDRRPAVG